MNQLSSFGVENAVKGRNKRDEEEERGSEYSLLCSRREGGDPKSREHETDAEGDVGEERADEGRERNEVEGAPELEERGKEGRRVDDSPYGEGIAGRRDGGSFLPAHFPYPRSEQGDAEEREDDSAKCDDDASRVRVHSCKRLVSEASNFFSLKLSQVFKVVGSCHRKMKGDRNPYPTFSYPNDRHA